MAGGKVVAAGVICLPLGPLETNCYVLYGAEGAGAFVIDPGADAGRVAKEIESGRLKIDCIVNTHGHFDHVGAVAELKKRLNARTAIHGADVTLLKESHEHGAFYGYFTEQQAPDIILKDGSTLTTSDGLLTLEVIHTPGHTRGGVCLLERSNGLLFTGDTLFAGSIGRTDFEGGSYEELMKSIREKILPLGDKVRIFPGHGPESTIGREKKNNPFLREIA